MIPSQLNAVEQRLIELSGKWEVFSAHPTARVLRWVADADARQIADTFLELHSQHPAGLPDFFLPFDLPFRDDTSYAADLLRAWRAWFDTQRDDLIDLSRDPTWRPPSPRAGEPGAAAVVRAASSFRQTYASDFRHLAVALVPSAVADPLAWGRWVTSLASIDTPAEVRFLTIDPAEAPMLNGAAAAAPKCVLTQVIQVRMSDVYRELLAEAGGSGPGVVFRKHFVGMMAAVKDGDFAAAESAGKNALIVATAEQWPDLQVAAQMGLSGVWAGAGRSADALVGYRAAVGFADTLPTDHPAAGPLRVQTRMAVGGALFGANDYARAAAVYAEAAPLAVDPLLQMENWRMAAACYALLKDDESAWSCGEKAIVIAIEIPRDVREKSTLAFAGQGQLRLCGKRPFADRKEKLIADMNALVGRGWEARRV